MAALNFNNSVDSKSLTLVTAHIKEVFESARVNGVADENLGKALDLMGASFESGNIAVSNCTFYGGEKMPPRYPDIAPSPVVNPADFGAVDDDDEGADESEEDY